MPKPSATTPMIKSSRMPIPPSIPSLLPAGVARNHFLLGALAHLLDLFDAPQAPAGAVGGEGDDRREQPDADPPEPDLHLVAEPEEDEEAVGRAGEEDEEPPAQEAEPERGPQRRVARAVEHVVAPAIARQPALRPWPDGEHPGDHGRE